MERHRLMIVALLIGAIAPCSARAEVAIGCTTGSPGRIGLSTRLGIVVLGVASGEDHTHFSLEVEQDLQAPEDPILHRELYSGIGFGIAQASEDSRQSYFEAHVPIGMLVRPGPDVELFAEWDPALHIRESASFSWDGFTFGVRVLAWGRKARPTPSAAPGAATDAPARPEAP